MERRRRPQLRIAPAIVTITYAALIGAFALAAALAFGLGGREVASRMLEEAYMKGQTQREQVRRDLEIARERGRREAAEAKARAEEETAVTPRAADRTRQDAVPSDGVDGPGAVR